MTKKLRIGILISGGGTNMQAIVKACEKGEIDGEVVFVGSDNLKAKGLTWAKQTKIDNFVFDFARAKNEFHDKFYAQSPWDDIGFNQRDFIDSYKKSVFVHSMFEGNLYEQRFYLYYKLKAEERLLDMIALFDFDLLVLAGYMQICTSYFIDKINGDAKLPKIMNIHPALLPLFPGEHGYADTFNYGCKVGGCTVHFIDYGEDTGPIIGQRSFSILLGDTLDDVKQAGLNLEYELFPECIQLYAEGRLSVVKNGIGKDVVNIQAEEQGLNRSFI